MIKQDKIDNYFIQVSTDIKMLSYCLETIRLRGFIPSFNMGIQGDLDKLLEEALSLKERFKDVNGF